jgi:hypothetical protein
VLGSVVPILDTHIRDIQVRDAKSLGRLSMTLPEVVDLLLDIRSLAVSGVHPSDGDVGVNADRL